MALLGAGAMSLKWRLLAMQLGLKLYFDHLVFVSCVLYITSSTTFVVPYFLPCPLFVSDLQLMCFDFVGLRK